MKYNYDINYFKVINTEEKAYWLGFIYADGCITSDIRQQLIIELCKQDRIILEKFIDCINGNNKIYENKYSYRLSICQKDFTNNLLNKGVFPRKSLLLEFPSTDIIPTQLIRHFIRGYFDGDGCISCNQYYNKTQNKHSYVSEFNILGTNAFIKSISEILPSSKYKIKHETKQSNVYKYRVDNRVDIIRIFHYLYDDANIYLERKYNKFMDIADIENKYLQKYTRKVG